MSDNWRCKSILGHLLIGDQENLDVAKDLVFDADDYVEMMREAFEYACECGFFDEAATILSIGTDATRPYNDGEWKHEGLKKTYRPGDYHKFMLQTDWPICHISYTEKGGLQIWPADDECNSYFLERDVIKCMVHAVPFTNENWEKACEDGHDALTSDIITNLEDEAYMQMWRIYREDYFPVIRRFYEAGYKDEILPDDEEDALNEFEELVEEYDIDFFNFGKLVFNTDDFHGEGGLKNPWIYPSYNDADLLKKYSLPNTAVDLLEYTKELVKAL